MKRIMMVIMAVALVALPTMAQSFGEQEQPKAQFQSTSVMQTSGSAYASQPALNADGTVAYGTMQEANSNSSQLPGGGPRKADAYTPPTPVGDAVLPLTLMALVFGGYIAIRRRMAKRVE